MMKRIEVRDKEVQMRKAKQLVENVRKEGQSRNKKKY